MICDVMVENLFAWSASITSSLNHADHATLVWYSRSARYLQHSSTKQAIRPHLVSSFPLHLSLFLTERQTSPIQKIDFTQSTFSSHGSGKVL